MEGVRPSLVAALLFLTLVMLAASASDGGGDDAAAAAVEVEEHPLADDEPYMLVAFHNKDGGEEIRLLADKGTKTLAASGFANRSGHWFYRHRRRLLPKPNNNTPSRGSSRTDAERFWNTLGALANATAAIGDDPDPVAAADDDDDERYLLVGMQTSGGDKIRLVVVADQRYFFITGFAKGWFLPPRWSFRDGERHRLLTTLGSNGSSSSHGGSSSSSHAEVVASNVLAVMMNDGKQA